MRFNLKIGHMKKKQQNKLIYFSYRSEQRITLILFALNGFFFHFSLNYALSLLVDELTARNKEEINNMMKTASMR